jgi:hypothetical protein
MDSQVTRSRQRILESAVVLLRQGNLPGLLVEAAAAAARVPLANAKQFFQNDEELILAFYHRLANDLEDRASALPPEGVAERFRVLMLAKLGLVGPYREAFAALFAKMLDPRTNIGVFSKQTELVRLRARAAFAKVVHGAHDPPGDATRAHSNRCIGSGSRDRLGLRACHGGRRSNARDACYVVLGPRSPAVVERRLAARRSRVPLVDQRHRPPLSRSFRRAARRWHGPRENRRKAKNVPAWVTVVAWTSFAAVGVLFLYSAKLF